MTLARKFTYNTIMRNSRIVDNKICIYFVETGRNIVNVSQQVEMKKSEDHKEVIEQYDGRIHASQDFAEFYKEPRNKNLSVLSSKAQNYRFENIMEIL